MGFTPKVVLNDSKGITSDVTAVVDSLKCNKINGHRSGHWMDLKLPDGKSLTLLAPIVEVHRGASAIITEMKNGEKIEKPTKPTLLLHLTKGDAGCDSLGQFLTLVDDRVKQLCVDHIKELESKAKNQNAEYVNEEFKPWDSRAKDSFNKKLIGGKVGEADDAPMWISCKIMVRKDSDEQDTSNWLVGVKEITEEGTIKKYADASELKKGNMKVQASLEISSMMQSTNKGQVNFRVDLQVREILIVERMEACSQGNETATAEADPKVAEMMKKRKAAAEAKAAKEKDGVAPADQPVAAPLAAAPSAAPSALAAFVDSDDEEDAAPKKVQKTKKRVSALSDDE
jgi:hypothetical protein